MNLTGITTWIKSNLLISIGVAIVAIFLFFPKVLKGITGTTPRRRRKRPVLRRAHRTRHSANVHRAITGRSHAPRRRRMKGAKKPWQVKGSLAARRHMALIRKRR